MYDIKQNKTCPEELAVCIPGAAIMDNDDFKDDTLTGANSSHCTNVMFVQPLDMSRHVSYLMICSNIWLFLVFIVVIAWNIAII